MMTGAQAWSIIAPILAASGMLNTDRNEFREAYVVTYCALADHDEHQEEKQADGENE